MMHGLHFARDRNCKLCYVIFLEIRDASHGPGPWITIEEAIVLYGSEPATVARVAVGCTNVAPWCAAYATRFCVSTRDWWQCGGVQRALIPLPGDDPGSIRVFVIGGDNNSLTLLNTIQN